jgi:hypothetical protein
MLAIKPDLVAALDSPDGLPTALQNAIRLEHATIPPYLYALYSLGTDNTEIAGLIESVVIEEMGHFALAANVLNAIGGTPVIDDPGFVPTYPGPLPATVEGGLVVPLERFSLQLTESVFMVIEQPEDPLVIPMDELAAGRPVTIGEFYDKIKRAIVAAGKSIFTGKREHQVTSGFFSSQDIELVEVHDVKTAGKAIDLIVEQGEGTAKSPIDSLVPGEELAHYYRFAEIVRGKQLEHDAKVEPPWRYAGPSIPFDPSKVLPVVTNPTSAGYPAGSAARHGCDTFNYTYTGLLKALHETFNGTPKRLAAAVGLMESLHEQAQTLVTIDSGLDGNAGPTKAGPSFEYRPGTA